jgi:hypothetical protein
MRYLLEYSNYSDFDIWKLKSHDLNLLGYNNDGGYNWDYVEFSNINRLNELLKNFNYQFVEETTDYLTIHFTDPKRFENFQAGMHNYDPSECYYTIRIYHFYVFLFLLI